MASEGYDVGKVEKILDGIFEEKPNVLEAYLVTDVLMKMIFEATPEKDRESVLKAFISGSVVHYFASSGRSDVSHEKINGLVDRVIEEVATW